MIRLYNSLSRQKEELPPSKELKVFICGPTVYDDAHIGHARTYLFFDFFVKYLRAQKRKVFYLQNITDLDDKIIKRAAELGMTPQALSCRFMTSYRDDMKALGVTAVTKFAPATRFIKQIVSQAERLIERGFAYEIKGDGWYFDITKDAAYGALSGRTAAQAEDATSRIDEAIGKRNRGDFCLWKFSKPGEPVWESKLLGAGRPGWHIEDTAITEKFFGPHYDIHGGGVDLKFPHHEAEMAQQTSAAGMQPEEFVKIWMHTGALLAGGQKMSKSLGNFVTIKDFLRKYPAEVLRLMVMSHHYRAPMDYSEKTAEDAYAGWKNLRYSLGLIEFAVTKKTTGQDRPAEFPTAVETALQDDMNTPAALAAVFETIRDTQKHLWSINHRSLRAARDFIKKELNLFGLLPPKPAKIPAKIKQIAAMRELSRSNKQFEQSDALRKQIESLGYIIEDTPKGPFLWKK